MIGCLRAGSLLASTLAGRAGDAERLELEAHLADCARCRAEHGSLAVLRRLKEGEPPRLSDLARERVRREVLAAGKRAVAASAPTRKTGRRLALGLIGAAAIAAIALLFVGVRGDRVVAGDLTVDGVRRAGIGQDAAIASTAGGVILVGGATVELAADTAVAWHSGARTLDLHRGAVTVDVVPGQAKRFRVAAQRFVVEVVGTHFSVDRESVRTERGTVHVLSPAGALLATVAAGQSWHSAPVAAGPVAATSPLAVVGAGPVAASPPLAVVGAGPVAASPPLAAVGAGPVAASPPPAVVGAGPVVASPPLAVVGAGPVAATSRFAAIDAEAARQRARSSVAAPDRLAEARRALATGHAARARSLLQPLLDAPDGAEAHALLAESFLVEARYPEAIAAYRSVARDFDGTPQAESALFTIAELEAERAHPAEAKRALAGYLARYPTGRFAREAQRRLDRLAH